MKLTATKPTVKKLAMALLSALMVTALMAQALPGGGVAAPAQDDIELCLVVGSPIALSGGGIVPLDSQNKKLAPTLVGDRTLVPLRAIGEHFAAEVSYSAADHTALISAGANSAEFPIGEGWFTLNGQRVELDAPTLLEEGRVLAPLRAVCEQVLGLPVAYERGVIVVGRSSISADRVEEILQRIGQFVRPDSLEALSAMLSSYGGIAVDMLEVMDEAAPMEPASGTASNSAVRGEAGAAPAPEAQADGGAKSTGDYSSTNTQTEGVDEGDVIKTDGELIYLCTGDQLKLIRPNGGAPELAAELNLGEGAYAEELYVDGDTVTVVGSRYRRGGDYGGGSYSFVKVYDASNPSAPKLRREYEISGSTVTSRRQDGILYLLTNYYSYGGIDPRPIVCHGGLEQPVAMADILVPRTPSGGSLSTLSAIDTRDPKEPVVSETVLVGGSGHYMSSAAFYVAGTVYAGGSNSTHIAKFELDGTSIGYAGSGVVKGSLLNQFSMDEHKGNLRVATTDWNPRANHLFVLDADMNICGSVQGYAPEERIYSARFMGDRGYVVTFRETDPLFVFDLSNPANPAVTGELKVPGFSSYLHPVSDTVLLGVGQEVGDLVYRSPSGEEVVVGQQTAGIKLSLFDVSDMGRPREIDTLVLGTSGHSELLSNHKAAMFRQDRGQLCFPVNLYGSGEAESFTGMSMISYAGNKLQELGHLTYENPYTTYEKEGARLYLPQRTVYIGEHLYYLQDGLLRCFDYSTLEELGRLTLTEVEAKGS